MDTNASFLTATEAICKIKAKQLSSVELMSACIKQIESQEPRLKAWTYFDKKLVSSQAHAFDEKHARGEAVGGLAGIPIGIKDIFNTVDMPTQMGSPIWKGFTPGNDARAVFYLRCADAVIAGKTVTAEFAVHAPGPTINPHDSSRIPGTSSSGSAVAVASNMVPCALGTQTAGSIIRPASYCGVYGFKPSFGLIPRTGMLKTTDSLDTVGFFTRSADDLELLFEALRVHGEDYPVSHRALSNVELQNKNGPQWKVAVIKSPVWQFAEKYAQEALFDFAEALSKEKDFEICEEELAGIFSGAHDVHARIYDKTLSYYFKNEFQQHALISKEIKEMIEHGNTLTLDDYKAALSRQVEIAAALSDLFERFDVILTLSTAGEAPAIGLGEKPDSCLIWTLCGVPAINLPLLRGSHGLPLGIQIVARRYSDIKLLRFAKAVCKMKFNFINEKMENSVNG